MFGIGKSSDFKVVLAFRMPVPDDGEARLFNQGWVGHIIVMMIITTTTIITTTIIITMTINHSSFFYSEESASASRTSMAMSNRCPQLQSVVLRRSFQATIQTPATCGWWIWFKNIVLTLWIQVIIIIIVLTIIIVNIIITLCQNVFSSKSDQDS